MCKDLIFEVVKGPDDHHEIVSLTSTVKDLNLNDENQFILQCEK